MRAIWKIKGNVFEIEEGLPLLMGILNLTPDSFSDGGEFITPDQALRRALAFAGEGAAIIDIGAESTRPGVSSISAEEEISRLIPSLELILKHVKLPVSIDTTKSEVAEIALRKGAAIVNDVSGLRLDENMAKVIAKHEAGAVIMHRRGDAKTMQSFTDYGDLVSDVLAELRESLGIADQAGIPEECIAIDPGLGFSKTAGQNFEIIKRLREFEVLGRPLMIGHSRKSFLGQLSGKGPRERDAVSATLSALLAERGAHVLRVHDVAATREAVLIANKISSLSFPNAFIGNLKTEIPDKNIRG